VPRGNGEKKPTGNLRGVTSILQAENGRGTSEHGEQAIKYRNRIGAKLSGPAADLDIVHADGDRRKESAVLAAEARPGIVDGDNTALSIEESGIGIERGQKGSSITHGQLNGRGIRWRAEFHDGGTSTAKRLGIR
jgi:hypothetical protein